MFDFLHPESGESDGAGGHTVAATSNNFLGTIENGMGMSTFLLYIVSMKYAQHCFLAIGFLGMFKC